MSLLSIIVPVYNMERFLGECVDSILNQNFTDFELILVDDGSKDASPDLCDEYAKKDSRVKVIHKANGGVSSARNMGLDAAKSDYVALIDSDDFVDANMYGVMVGEMMASDYDLVVCGYDYVDEDSRVQRPYNTAPNRVLDKNQLIYEFLNIDPTVRFGTCNKVFKRQLIGDLRYDENLKSGEDGEFLFRYIMKMTNPTLFVEKPFFKNRERQGSATHGGLSGESLIGGIKMHKKMAQEIKKEFPSLYHHAYAFYIDILLRAYKLSINDSAFHKNIMKIVNGEKIAVLFCKEMTLKSRITFFLKR